MTPAPAEAARSTSGAAAGKRVLLCTRNAIQRDAAPVGTAPRCCSFYAVSYTHLGFLHHPGVEIRKFPDIIRLKDVLYSGNRLEQQVPVLRGGHSVQTGQKIFIHPLAQGLSLIHI